MKPINPIQKSAASIVRRLFDEGYIAYFAGGWVRDYLLGNLSEEIDIATSATPQKIMSLFPKTIPVGVAFGVVIVVFEGHHFEVSTFRKDHPYVDGRHPEGVDFSTPEKDALRRDFTINGMFFDPLSETLYDYVEGEADLKKGVIRAIGDATKRFEEDRLRMIRGVRFATRFGFKIDPSTEKAILDHASTLFPAVSIERIWQELVKMNNNKHFAMSLLTMHRLKLLEVIFPDLKDVSMKEMEKRISFFPYFPLQTPTILYLLDLFPEASLEKCVWLCHYLKTSTKEVKLVTFFKQAETLFKAPHDLFTWAHFYAHKEASLFLQIHEAKLGVDDRILFAKEHEKRQKELASPIKRIEEHKPVVSSHHLLKQGIKPSVEMGLLLKEAEKIAINEDLHHASDVMDILKKSPHWPKK
jgi:poly(A) polymerase